MVRFRAAWSTIRASLFWLPAILLTAGAILAGVVALLEEPLGRLPLVLPASRDQTSTVLQVVTTSTITVVGLVASIMVVAVQLASSQLSPRVLRRFLRDPVDQFSIGIVAGTFSYALVALATLPQFVTTPRSLRATVAVVLAGASLLAILAFIDHTARSIRAGDAVRVIAEQTRELIARVYPPRFGEEIATDASEEPPQGPGTWIRAPSDGWIQQLDLAVLLRALPEDSTARIELPVGKFAIEDTPLLTVWTPPDDYDLAPALLAAYELGRQRDMVQDVAFGIRQLVDIGLRALSPGINDPGTAYEVITSLGAVLADLLPRELTPRAIADDHGRRVLHPYGRDAERYVHLALEQLGGPVADHPAIAVAMINTMARVAEVVEARGGSDHRELLIHQAERVCESVERRDHLPADQRRVREAAARLSDGA